MTANKVPLGVIEHSEERSFAVVVQKAKAVAQITGSFSSTYRVLCISGSKGNRKRSPLKLAISTNTAVTLDIPASRTSGLVLATFGDCAKHPQRSAFARQVETGRRYRLGVLKEDADQNFPQMLADRLFSTRSDSSPECHDDPATQAALFGEPMRLRRLEHRRTPRNSDRQATTAQQFS